MMESVGVQKALSFLFMAVAGRAVKSRFTPPQVLGVQKLILDVMLPCVVFQSLCSIELSMALIKWPLMGACFVVWQLVVMGAVSSACFPGPALATPRRTAAFQLATFGPGLSAIVFIKEFVGPEAAGLASLFDLPSKAYVIFVLPALLEWAGRSKGSTTRSSAALVKDAAPCGAFAKTCSLLQDPLNFAIAAGLLMAATRTPLASLSFVGRGVTALSGAQSPVLFVLIGMKLKTGGATPAACVSLLLARLTSSYCFFAVTRFAVPSLTTPEAMTLLLSVQAACSVVGWSQMSKASAQGAQGFALDLAFDIVGFSLPLAMVIQTAVCLVPPEQAIQAPPYMTVPAAALGLLLFATVKTALRDPESWKPPKCKV